VVVKSTGDISAEPARGQKIEEHVVTDLNVRNDENRPSLTSSAAAEELQNVSSKNTMDEMADAITGGNVLVSGSTGQPIYRKKAGILVEI